MEKYDIKTVDLELLKKYGKPGPRYTSYPTAPHFSADFTAGDYIRELRNGDQAYPPSDLSLYFHFPFCPQLCYFCGCNVIITQKEERVNHYLSLLKREIDLVTSYISTDRPVVQMHWGGGTPTFLSVEQIKDIYSYISNAFNFHPDAEISIEIDPRRLTPEHLPSLRELGFNRVSYGIQDFNPMVQETINRVQSDEQNNYVLEESRRLGFNSVNLDLIYGLPHQTLESYSETMKQVIEMSPDRLAVFNYAHVPWLKKHQTILPVDKMPMPDERLKMLKMIIEKLTDADYAFIGMDHFAKPEDELTKALNAGTLHRNFQGYTTRSGTEVLAMGVSSISQLERSYTQNTKNVREYEQRLDESILPINVGICLTDDDIIRRYVIGEIMCNHRLDFRAVERRYEINFATYFPDFYQKLEPFFEDGLVEVDSQSIRVLSAGKLVVRNIAMIFDAYLGQSSSGKKSANASSKQPRYSQTV